MILGLSTSAFTLLHVAISLVGIAAGFVAIGALTKNRWLASWNTLFLITTIATSVTGFLFHSKGFGPPEIIGVISLIVLSVALLALYLGHLQEWWRLTYVISAVIALYLNFFVGVVQAFQKIPVLAAQAATQSEPPFVVVQLVVMVAFIAFGFSAAKRFAPRSGFNGQRLLETE
jgi:hypothetical protein